MKLKTVLTLSNQDDPDQFRRWASQVVSDIVNAINGNLSLTDNTSGAFVDVTFPGANTTVQVAHTLKGTPNGYTVIGRSAAITVFDGNKGNTTQFLYVQASGAGTARLYVF